MSSPGVPLTLCGAPWSGRRRGLTGNRRWWWCNRRPSSDGDAKGITCAGATLHALDDHRSPWSSKSASSRWRVIMSCGASAASPTSCCSSGAYGSPREPCASPCPPVTVECQAIVCRHSAGARSCTITPVPLLSVACPRTSSPEVPEPCRSGSRGAFSDGGGTDPVRVGTGERSTRPRRPGSADRLEAGARRMGAGHCGGHQERQSESPRREAPPPPQSLYRSPSNPCRHARRASRY
jgi:hypothetical protein